MANELINFTVDRGEEDNYGYFHGLATVGMDAYFGDSGNGNCAYRFTNIDIDQSQSFDMCELMIRVNSIGATSSNIKFIARGIDEDNTGDFSGSPFGRSQTTAQTTVDSSVPSVGSLFTVNVKSIVEEITSRGGWSNGNALGIRLNNNGSASGIYMKGSSSTFLAYRLSAPPNYKPTPKSVSAPSLPSASNFGIKIAKANSSVFTAGDEDLFYTSRKKIFKVYDEAYYKTTASDATLGYKVIPHNLGYIPFVSVYAKSSVFGGSWKKLPMNWAFETYPDYSIDDTNLTIFTPVENDELYYYIFLDQIS